MTQMKTLQLQLARMVAEQIIDNVDDAMDTVDERIPDDERFDITFCEADTVTGSFTSLMESMVHDILVDEGYAE